MPVVNNQTKISISDSMNYDFSNSDINWSDYGISDNDVNFSNFKSSYQDLSTKYGDKIIFIQMYFSNAKLKKQGINIQLNLVFNKLLNEENLQYKNPYLLLLGYWFSKQPTLPNIKIVFDIMSTVEEYNFQPPDLIRYHRFWTLKSKT